MSTITQAVYDYLQLRRGHGYKLKMHQKLLLNFADFLQHHQADYVTQELALKWAQLPQNVKPGYWKQRLTVVRGFTQYLKGLDPRTQIPAPDLLPSAPSRPIPYLYSDQTIEALLDAARNMPARNPKDKLQPWTFYCLFGLLSVSGMRVGEVRRLRLEDVDLKAAVLTVRAGKNDNERYVPLHETTRDVLSDYIKRRERHWHGQLVSDHLFVSGSGKMLHHQSILRTFHQLSHQIGLRDKDVKHRPPRLHELRHSFANKVLADWYRNDQDPERMLPVLSTYLGHVSVSNTYWYLQNNPALMKHAMTRLEHRWEGQS